MAEQEVPVTWTPLLGTDLQGSVRHVGRSHSTGVARTAYAHVPPDQDDRLLCKVWEQVRSHREARSFSEAQTLLGKEPTFIVVGPSFLHKFEVDLEQAHQAMARQGHVLVLNNKTRILLGNLPDRVALVTSDPNDTGIYLRTGDYVALLISVPSVVAVSEVDAVG